jgi:GTPase SAR1 family protein
MEVLTQILTKPILIYDCSGQARHRINWRLFYPEVDAVIFVIDCIDTPRFYNVGELIHEVLADPILDKKKTPIVFLANK